MQELPKNHLFVGHNGSVTLYCDEKECMLFDDILEKIMTDDFFNQICHTYFSLIEHIKSCSKEELHALLVEIWPILTIFQEVSQNPDLVSASDIRRLQRIRETTEKEVYDLFSLLEPVEEPDYYYFFKGEMYPEELDINTLRIAS